MSASCWSGTLTIISVAGDRRDPASAGLHNQNNKRRGSIPNTRHAEMIERKKELVAGVAEIREPLRILHDRVELVTMNDEDASAIRRDMNRALLNGNISVSAGKRGNELVVIARNINHRHALARFPQNFL